MTEKIILITGANGEVGHGLVEQLSAQPDGLLTVAMDIREADEFVRTHVDKTMIGDVLDELHAGRDPAVVIDGDGLPVAIVNVEENQVHPKRVLNRPG